MKNYVKNHKNIFGVTKTDDRQKYFEFENIFFSVNI